MPLKSWGLELWDQIDKVFAYCQQGQEQLELYHKTLNDVQKIYCSLSRKHKALVVPIRNNKVKLILDNSSYLNSLDKMFTCMSEQAAVFEKQAEDIKVQCINPVKILIDEMRSTLSSQNNEYSRFKGNIETQKRHLDRAWAKYYTAFINRKKMDISYLKIKDDKTVPRLDIEKAQAQVASKKADFERTRGEYAEALQKFNESIAQLYLKDLPKICSALEMIDAKRCDVSVKVGRTLVDIQRENLKNTERISGDEFDNAVCMIDGKKDADELVKILKSRLVQPPSMVFVDLDKIPEEVGGGVTDPNSFKPSQIPGLLQHGGKAGRGESAKSLFGNSGLKGLELKEMLPEQVKSRISNIQDANKNVEKQLNGLKTLYQTFEKDPKMGDKNSLQPEIDVNERQMESLRLMEEDVVQYYDANIRDKPQFGGGAQNYNGAGSISRTKTKSFDDSEDGGSDFSDDPDDGPVAEVTGSDNGSFSTTDGSQKTASVLYNFDATDSQQMSVKGGEIVYVIKYDEGSSGWTLAQSMTNSNLRGFIPTNYIELK